MCTGKVPQCLQKRRQRAFSDTALSSPEEIDPCLKSCCNMMVFSEPHCHSFSWAKIGTILQEDGLQHKKLLRSWHLVSTAYLQICKNNTANQPSASCQAFVFVESQTATSALPFPDALALLVQCAADAPDQYGIRPDGAQLACLLCPS